MESDKKPEDKKPEDTKPADTTTPGKDAEGSQSQGALDQPTEDQANSEVVDATSPGDKKAAKAAADNAKPPKRPNSLKVFFKRFGIYFLAVILIAVVGGAFAVINSLNGRKASPNVSVSSQALSQNQLKQLAHSNSTGGSGQTLTVQGNADFSGQVLTHGNLDVAGTIQLGSGLSLPKLTVSGTSSLNTVQIGSLQIAQGAVFQSAPTFQNGMNVAGNAQFSAMSVPNPGPGGNLTITNLTVSDGGRFNLPNHIAFFNQPSPAVPGRTIDFNVLGGGGSASIFGSDTSGTVTINTGNRPVAGCFVDIRFNIPFTQLPNVIIAPNGLGAGEADYYAEKTLTDFHICTDNAAPANSAFAYSYFVTN